MGICSALISFLDAGVFAFIYPGLVSSFQKQDALGFQQGTRKLLIQTVGLSIFFAVVVLLFIVDLVSWLDKPIYSDQLYLFPWLLLATVLYSIGMVPHFALYAQGWDRPIIHSHIISLVVFVMTVWALSMTRPDFAVPIGLCASFLFILCWKIWSYLRLTGVQYRFF